MAVPFYIISQMKILAAFNFQGFASSAKIAKVNRRWNVLVLQYAWPMRHSETKSAFYYLQRTYCCPSLFLNGYSLTYLRTGHLTILQSLDVLQLFPCFRIHHGMSFVPYRTHDWKHKIQYNVLKNHALSVVGICQIMMGVFHARSGS